MDLLPAPYHFAASFLVTVAALGAAWVTIYRPKFVPPGHWRRVAFGVGWMLLALGELLHGAQVLSSDRDPLVIILRVSAYALVVAGLQPLVLGGKQDETAEAAAPSTELADDGEEGPGDVERLSVEKPTSEPRRAAWGTPVPAVRRLVVALALFAISEACFLSLESLRSSEPGTLWLTVHGLRLAGGIAVLAWLGQVVRTSIQARVVAVFIMLLLIIVVAISGSMTHVLTANITQDSFRQARQEGAVQNRLLQQQVRDSISSAKQVAKLDPVRDAFGNPAALSEQASSLQTSGGSFESADFIAFLNDSGAILALSATAPRGRTTLVTASVPARLLTSGTSKVVR
ncbi:MAG TPA: hypothetical protein VHJ40_05580, partial [Actinomycetota bacterium]|nr:hypothetical protein [Actinomycetota bacterium]